ncbi:plastocyanin/azurin family copper-binding protein [Cohnella soli]|uniref:Plastocyanin/azurin family copper-binding protein n=1 Tax=Cohnella soli TaxID=425005 RepID=A0ABW0HX98_9BACL
MKNRLKRSLAFSVLAGLIVVLSGCASSGKEEGQQASNNVHSESAHTSVPSETSQISSEASSSPSPSESSSVSTHESVGKDHGSSPGASESAGTKPSTQASESTKPSAKPSAKPSSSPKPVSKPSSEPSASTAAGIGAKPAESAQASAEASEKVVIVEIKDFAFSPSEVTVRKGATVKFINRDDVKHTATSNDGIFDTGLLGKDVAEEVKFDKTGEYAYYCTPHPGMTGTIKVEDE